MRSSLLVAMAVGGVSIAVACSRGAPNDNASSDDIIGGVEATGAKLNAIGSVGHKVGDAGFDYFCTATLIAPDLVLTAKHCATEGPPGNHRYLDDGEVYFAVGPDSTKPLSMVKAKTVVISPVDEGGFVKYGSDVAVYVLESPITDVKPMRFARSALARDQVGKIFTAVGFGVRDRESNSGQRRAGAVTLRAAEGKPMQVMFGNKEAFLGYLREKEDDAYIAANQAKLDEFWEFSLLGSYEAYLGLGKDDAQPCSGDSGGPLVRKGDDGELEVVAVVSGSFKGWKYRCSLLGESYATFGPKVQDMIRDTIACKGVAIDGSCEGTVAVRCVSDAEGPQKVTRTDCGLINQVCKIDALSKRAACADDEPPMPANDAGPLPDAASPDSAVEAGPDAGPG